MPTPPPEPPSPPPELAQRLPTQATWDDLVLPPAALAQLHQIVERVVQLRRLRATADAAWSLRHAHGTSALFVGASGTGKTLAAEVLARDLGLDLWRVDLSAVSAGTSARPRRTWLDVFDAAEQSGAILLFEDADALLGNAQRGQGQPRPLRQPGGRVSSAAPRASRGPHDPHDQPATRDRSGVHAAPAPRRGLPAAGRGSARRSGVASSLRAPTSITWTSAASPRWRSPAAPSGTSPLALLFAPPHRPPRSRCR